MVHINVFLDPNPQGVRVFYPGQRLCGVAELHLDQPKKFRGFYVVISGIAKCHWTETRTRETGTGDNRRTESYTVSYDGKEVFLNSKTYLFGYHGAEVVQIAAGVYKYNFAVELPQLLPASLSGSIGSIEYKVETVLDIPWRFDKEVSVPFTVMRHENLNDYPDLRIGLHQEEVKTFCCLFCQSGPCVINVSIPQGGFVSGQTIPIKIEYANRSNVEIQRTFVKFKRTFAFTSSSPETKTKYENEKMLEICVNGAGKGQTNVVECSLVVPANMINSNSRFCRVFQVSYTVEVESVVSECHKNPKIRIPITIGNVAIGETTTFNAVPVVYPNAPGVYPINPISNIYPPEHKAPPGVYPSAPTLIDTSYNDPPPSFQEATKYDKNNFIQPQPSGWNLNLPSAPNEKM